MDWIVSMDTFSVRIWNSFHIHIHIGINHEIMSCDQSMRSTWITFSHTVSYGIYLLTLFQSRLSTWLGRSKGNSMPACSASSRLTASVAVAGGWVGSEARWDGGLLARLGSPELRRERESAGEVLLVDHEEQQGKSLPRARLKSLMNIG